MLGGIEKRLGLPKLSESMKTMSEAMKLAQSPTMKKLDKLLFSVEKLSEGTASIKEVISLLELVGKLDRDGTLDKLMQMLVLLKPIATSRGAKTLMENLDKIVHAIEAEDS